jgi:hypothetical protein
MRTDANGEVRAPYRKHQWEVDGLSYFRLDCANQVAVRFERGAERADPSPSKPARRQELPIPPPASAGLGHGGAQLVARHA